MIGHYPPLVYVALALVAVSHVVLFRTPFGLRLRATGEHPEAVDTLGVNVRAMRFAGVLMSGALAGSGRRVPGAQHSPVREEHVGREGVHRARGHDIRQVEPRRRALLACLLFGYAEAVQMGLQGRAVPTQFVQMIPYVLTMVALVGVIGRARPPAASGKPY